MSQPFRIELITLGNELLVGLRENSHLMWIGGELASLGLPLARCRVLLDEPEEVSREFRTAWENSDLVITTGGLGPTADDVTRETIAEVLGCPLEHHAPTEAALRERFNRLGREPTRNNLKQTYILSGAEALPNPNGTAPGQFMRKDGKILVMLPGPPGELCPMWTDAVLPRLRECGLLLGEPVRLQIRVAGVGESQIETELQPIFNRFPGRLEVAYCAHQGVVDVRLSGIGQCLTKKELQEIGDLCRERLGDGFATYGERSLVDLVLELLRQRKWRLAVAESCTGGLLGSVITDVPGASDVFAGGVVCYENDAKVQLLGVPECLLKQHGAVSHECAVAMATAAAERFDAEAALSITGIAGPSGGTPGKPVGTVYLGLHTPDGVWARQIHHPASRRVIKERAVTVALDWLRRALLGK